MQGGGARRGEGGTGGGGVGGGGAVREGGARGPVGGRGRQEVAAVGGHCRGDRGEVVLVLDWVHDGDGWGWGVEDRSRRESDDYCNFTQHRVNKFQTEVEIVYDLMLACTIKLDEWGSTHREGVPRCSSSD